ncbi:lipooligosaccharide transport system permease protein [Actinoplanes octamycinicus]|uniref:Transport permease protein n=1 Tax=Actinoplanes octamycinicus TaxID=135948 RepID=A0A7W7M9W4_9ACTN|nr:ABC transporter permease [Actinoplanes octamycinicus]MBB4742443.1 lipooligosaccharide transport system permease protein [Actinoplanes octamycinicus]GIE62307.1 transport permease protein [Actinoplanes octamycinicus]
MTTILATREFGYWWHRYLRTWRGTIVISVANPLLFVTALGFGLGQLVDQNGADLPGGSYLAFIGPGLLAASAMQMGFINAGGPVFQSALAGGNYRSAVTTPMEPADILTGHLLFTTFRAVLDSAAILLVLVVFGSIGPASAPRALLGAVLTALAFATPMAAYAITVDRPAKLSAAFRFVIMPVYMFSGTFFPAEQLPDGLRQLVWLSPLWHGAELCRGAGDLAVHVLVLLVPIVAGYLAGRRTYTRRLTA